MSKNDDMLSWTVEFKVHRLWVADGFDLDSERALTMLENDLQYAYPGSELSAKVIKSPKKELIEYIQENG